jgi:hypothetical protein
VLHIPHLHAAVPAKQNDMPNQYVAVSSIKENGFDIGKSLKRHSATIY